jgi:hypothetical protein
MRSRSFLAALSLTTVVAVSSIGCTSRSQVFEGYSEDQLWTAMVATARAPQYDDWKVMDNEVHVDEASRRIEIYRVLKRTLVSPHADPQRESEEWKLQVVLGRDEELGQPLVDFTARQVDIPAHVWDEADRYFLQMRTLLGPVKTAQPAEANSESEIPMPPPLPAEESSGMDEPPIDPLPKSAPQK